MVFGTITKWPTDASGTTVEAIGDEWNSRYVEIDANFTVLLGGVSGEFWKAGGGWGVPVGTGDVNGHVVQDEGGSLTQRVNLDFIGAGVDAADGGTATEVTIPGVLVENDGTPVTQRSIVDYQGLAVTASDDAVDTTEVVIEPSRLDKNTEQLAGNKVLVDSDETIQYIDPDGVRTVTLPAAAAANKFYVIYNEGDTEITDAIRILNPSASELLRLEIDQAGICFSDSTTWIAQMTILDIQSYPNITSPSIVDELLLQTNSTRAYRAVAIKRILDAWPKCSLTDAGAQSIPNDTLTAIDFDTENYDASAMHDTVTNNSRVTIGEDGNYLIIGVVAFASNAVGYRQIGITINGGTDDVRMATAPANGTLASIMIAEQINLSAGDYIEIFVRQTSTAALNTSQFGETPHFSVTKIGE